ncbi:epoxide hydrolase 1-like [Callorhinchus milii]|uniref:epoxide hydrolase 1-like n=1 Tax=Callorhinchus milii TaxID=7868 RepID=UPI0004572B7B|nr:epoxide hydrolase 1-like [Callorhinchus milii]|eukprot:gi/632960824/ref/XP_007896418.1/ PREDICTED: epoxide hydrolase 1-like [Callorhinchus milii]
MQFCVDCPGVLQNYPETVKQKLLQHPGSWANVHFYCTALTSVVLRVTGIKIIIFTLDELLTNVMIYWVTGSITSSMQFYTENLKGNPIDRIDGKVETYIPTGLAAFPQEVGHMPLVWAKQMQKNVLSYSYMARGGHFAAFEEPGLLAEDIRRFVQMVEKRA